MSANNLAAAHEQQRRVSWTGPRSHWLLGCMRELQRNPLELYERAWTRRPSPAPSL
jgi:hypothetical protein